jgi:hypothetical protein
VGAPPPKPRQPGDSPAEAQRAGREFAAYYNANFKPWRARCPPDLWMAGWLAYVRDLREEARYGLPLECSRGVETAETRVRRETAASRLAVIEWVQTAFRTPADLPRMLRSHRARSRTLWGDDHPKPTGPAHAGCNAADRDERSAADCINQVLKKCGTNVDKRARLASAGKVENWAKELSGAYGKLGTALGKVLSDQRGGPQAARESLNSHWPAESSPLLHTATLALRP